MAALMTLQIDNGDCLELMKKLPDKSVDLFICDLPYGETNCKWDSKIDLDKFWSEFRRLRKSKRTACIHFCSTKFGYTLIKSWEKGFKMDMVWKKRNKTGGLQSRHRPMRNHEMVYFFYEQAPKYNRDKYHKRIQAKKEHNIEKEGITMGRTSKMKNTIHKCFEPPNPASVLEESKFHKDYEKNGKRGMNKDEMYSKKCIKEFQEKNGIGFEPPNPASVLEEKEFCYGTDEYHKDSIAKRPIGKNAFEPPNPASVVEEDVTNEDYYKDKNGEHIGVFSDKAWKGQSHKLNKGLGGTTYNPGLPTSVVVSGAIEKDKDKILTDDNRFLSKSAYKGSVKETMKDYKNRMGSLFDPKQPTSVIEEKTIYGVEKDKAQKSGRKDFKGIGTQNYFDPPNPASVVEEHESVNYKTKSNEIHERTKAYMSGNKNLYEPRLPASVVEENAESNKVWGYDKPDTFKISKDGTNQNFEPPNPVSGAIEFIEPAEDEPKSMFESTKVFIGKRHHQTEKPQDILEFFLKYWSDEGDTILDPTMGSGSTGVACKKLNRNFIGYELDEKIFEVAKKRLD